jgi:hypothetical protein
LVDYGGVGPLGGGDVIYFAAEAGVVEAVLSVGFGHADEMGHYVGGFVGTLGDEDVDAGSGCAVAGARRLDYDFVGGFFGHGYGGDFADLEAGAEKFDARGAQGIAFEEGDLELALAEAQDYVNLLGFFHQQAGGWGLADDNVDGELAIDAVGYAEHQATGADEAGGFGDILAGEVGHGDFAAMDGDAHGGDGGEESGRGENEDEEGHLA